MLEQHFPKNREWSATIAVINHALINWCEFDGWALSHGFDPLELSSRRLMAAAWAFLTKDMDYELRDSLIESLFEEEIREYKQPEPAREKGGVIMAPPKERWRAPPGWKPPGWNEKKSYEEAKAAMSFNANPK